MANVYVGTSSAGAADGTSWANRYGTLNAAEDRPLSAGDVVYVGPGTYRELLTVDVSGSVGSPVTYVGDYTGANTDGVGGIVRITGAANETTAGTRANCITGTTKDYRTFRGFLFDGVSTTLVNMTTCTNWIVDQCVFLSHAGRSVLVDGATQAAITISNCVLIGGTSSAGNIEYSHTVAVDNAGHVVSGCYIIAARADGIRTARVGGVTVKNCTILGCGGGAGVRVGAALTVGQVVTLNNNIVYGNLVGLQATTTAEVSANYNTVFGNITARSNVTAGANDVAYPPGFDMRPYFEAFGAGTLVLPLASLASYSGLVEYSAGTGAPATDWRGHAVAGSLREFGVEEYVSGYGIEAGGGVTMWPLSSSFIGQILGAQ